MALVQQPRDVEAGSSGIFLSLLLSVLVRLSHYRQEQGKGGYTCSICPFYQERKTGQMPPCIWDDQCPPAAIWYEED